MCTTAKQDEGIGGLFLPFRVVGYIASFIKAKSDYNLLLNMYKAFESIHGDGYEDRFLYYKREIQSRIAMLAMDDVIRNRKHINTHTLTDREIMYIFDCYYCDPAVIMYGEETYEYIDENTYIVNTTQMQHIDNEFIDCSDFTDTLALPYLGIQFGLSDPSNIHMYKKIRLLEEAFRLNSTNLLTYIKDNIFLSPDMPLYIYMKHNHQIYAPNWYSLADNDLLLELCREFDILPIVLAMAIGGRHRQCLFSEDHLKYVVQPNLSVVKKIVPQYINASSKVVEYEDYYDDNAFVRSGDVLTPYMYWQSTYITQVKLFLLGEDTKIIKVMGNEEIGEYLQGLE
jgi:hypothetical protein